MLAPDACVYHKGSNQQIQQPHVQQQLQARIQNTVHVAEPPFLNIARPISIAIDNVLMQTDSIKVLRLNALPLVHLLYFLFPSISASYCSSTAILILLSWNYGSFPGPLYLPYICEYGQQCAMYETIKLACISHKNKFPYLLQQSPVSIWGHSSISYSRRLGSAYQSCFYSS